MQIQSLIGKKIDQTQGFLEDGTRVPLSVISVGGNVVSQIKKQDHEGYNSIQLGFGNSKRPSKPMAGHIKKAGLDQSPRFFREVRVDDEPTLELASKLNVSEVFELGDVVDVTGTSKGKGFAGVVKRHGFHGGPKTHGQSDRHRAPGSIGPGTTPGRVYKGKRMAGRMGNERVTIKNLEVLDIKEDTILVRGLVPGAKGSIVMITKVGKNKKFKPLWSEPKEEVETVEDVVQEAQVETASENVETVEETVETPNEQVETVESQASEGSEVSQSEPKAADTGSSVEPEEGNENAGK